MKIPLPETNHQTGRLQLGNLPAPMRELDLGANTGEISLENLPAGLTLLHLWCNLLTDPMDGHFFVMGQEAAKFCSRDPGSTWWRDESNVGQYCVKIWDEIGPRLTLETQSTGMRVKRQSNEAI